MKKLFVPHNLALLAKEKGFDDQCIGKFKDNNLTLLSYSWNNSELSIHNDGISAPMYQQLIDWFREEHNLNIWLIENPYTQGNGNGMYEWSIKPRMIKNQPLPQPKGFGSGCGESYYEALNKALEEAFKLI